MQRTVAVKMLSKMLGKGFSYEINPKAPDPDERAAAKEALPAATAEVDRLDKLMNERRRAVLAADSEYQSLVAAAKEARKTKTKISSVLYAHKFTVGHVDRVGGLGFFHVKAHGNSWEDVIAKCKAK